MSPEVPAGITVQPRAGEGSEAQAWDAADRVLTPDALRFVAQLQRRFGDRRKDLLARRRARQADLDAGTVSGFLVETRAIREGEWRVAPTPRALERRRVEITGP